MAFCRTGEPTDVEDIVRKVSKDWNYYQGEADDETEDVDDVASVDEPERKILQRYVRPLLLRGPKAPCVDSGYKFHLRVLVLAIGNLNVYVHDDPRVLVSPVPMELDKEDLNNLHSLVTNNSFNRNHPNYDERFCNQPLSESHQLQKYPIIQHIRNMCTNLFTNLLEAGNEHHFICLDNTYELFGLDFTMDCTGKIWLLEANAEPSLSFFKKNREELIGLDPLTLGPPLNDWSYVLRARLCF